MATESLELYESAFHATMPKAEADIALRDALIADYEKKVETLGRERDALREALGNLLSRISNDADAKSWFKLEQDAARLALKEST